MNSPSSEANTDKGIRKKINDVVMDSETTKRLDIDYIIGNVFGQEITQEVFSLNRITQDNLKSSSILECVQVCVRRKLESIDEQYEHTNVDSRPGKLGPKEVRFDVSTYVGLFVIGNDKLTVNSQSNFSTLRANACFYKGKWQYEVQLGSKGVMQIGWALADCKFSQEIGVGDTINSYSFDGHRVRSWNVATYPYGEPWLSGDVIGSTIDLDGGSIAFYRNGRSLGDAFTRVQMGPGFAYFPAVSLAFTENLVANFGTTPLKHPVDGFETPQKRPEGAVAKALLILDWFKNLLNLADPTYHDATSQVHDGLTVSHSGVVIALGHMLIHYLAQLLCNSYIIESCFIPFLVQLGNRKSATTINNSPSTISVPVVRLTNFLDMFWAFLEDYEIRRCMDVVAIYLQARFRRVSFTADYVLQKEVLQILITIFEHPRTRTHFLQYILFDKGRFANFAHVKPLDDKGLIYSIPDPWWSQEIADDTQEIRIKKYLDDCNKIKKSISAVETMQVDLMLSLLDNTTEGHTVKHASSRMIFLSKFRMFLHENFFYNRSLPITQTPLPITLCCFHRLVSCAQILSKTELNCELPKIPIKVFYDGSINYFNVDRFGGVVSHLRKVLNQELVEDLGSNHPIFNTTQSSQNQGSSQSTQGATSNNASPGGGLTVAVLPGILRPTAGADPNNEPPIQVAGTSGIAVDDNSPPGALMVPFLTRMLQGQTGGGMFQMMVQGQQALMHGLTQKLSIPGSPLEPEISIVELIDGIIMFYHLTAHKQLAKIATLRESMEEYEVALAETKLQLENSRSSDPLACGIMEKSIEVFENKLKEQSRHMAWVRAAVYSPEKQAHLVWLLRIVIATLKVASSKGKLLSFVPEFYLEAMVELTTALKSHFHPTVPIENIEGYRELLMDVGQFLCCHFADPRIVHASSKDTLIQALANFVCSSNTLRYLEELPVESQLTMVRGLLRPYENRAWAQSNWVLVRFWQGHGFAFRFKKSPHLKKKIGPKNINNDTTFTDTVEPCPSVVFQNHIRDVLLDDEKLAASFINSVLNQLNWAFSEFIGMLQEIQNLSTRPERVYIESRHLKICVTCFDLTLALLRVLEMMTNIALPIFSDMSRSTAESLLERICQLLCQILNRVSSLTGCFHYVVNIDIPDLEAVDHFPILAAVVGVLIGLLGTDMSLANTATNEGLEDGEVMQTGTMGVISKALLVEPSFQLPSLSFLVDDSGTKAGSISDQKKFSLNKYPDEVSSEELQAVNHMIDYLSWCQHRLSQSKETDEDTLCSICYAYATCVVFHPCKHQSCRSCIIHHLMNNQDCFFCKTHIQTVTMLTDGKVLYESAVPSPDNPTASSSSNIPFTN